jgi:hypothetical protein
MSVGPAFGTVFNLFAIGVLGMVVGWAVDAMVNVVNLQFIPGGFITADFVNVIYLFTLMLKIFGIIFILLSLINLWIEAGKKSSRQV